MSSKNYPTSLSRSFPILFPLPKHARKSPTPSRQSRPPEAEYGPAGGCGRGVGSLRPNFHSLTRKAHLDQRLSFLGTTPFEAGRGVLERPPSENRDGLDFRRPAERNAFLRREGQHTVVEPVKTKSHSEGQRFLAPQIGGGFGTPQFSAVLLLSCVQRCESWVRHDR